MDGEPISEAARSRHPARTGERVTASHFPAAEENAFEEQLFLFAFATQAEVLRHLRTEAAPSDRVRLEEIMELWSGRQARVVELLEREKGVSETIRAESLPAEAQERLRAIASEALFRKTFQDHPVSFELVEIDKLVAPQRTVNLAYCREVSAALPPSLTLNDLLTVCLEPTPSSRPPIQHLELHGNTHMFSSPSADVRFLNSVVREVRPDDVAHAESGGLPTTAVLAFVGYGCSTINVYRVGERTILNNGFHRVYALRSLGVTRIPVAAQHISDAHRELPPSILGLPTAYLLHAPRPVLVKDFFEPGFTIALKVRKRIRAIKVTVSASRYDVLV